MDTSRKGTNNKATSEGSDAQNYTSYIVEGITSFANCLIASAFVVMNCNLQDFRLVC